MKTVRVLVPATALALALTACSQAGQSSAAQNTATTTKADQALASLQGKVLSKGPHGETPSPASAVTLTAAEITKVKAKHATAAIVMHYGGNDWANAQIAGLKD